MPIAKFPPMSHVPQLQHRTGACGPRPGGLDEARGPRAAVPCPPRACIPSSRPPSRCAEPQSSRPRGPDRKCKARPGLCPSPVPHIPRRTYRPEDWLKSGLCRQRKLHQQAEAPPNTGGPGLGRGLALPTPLQSSTEFRGSQRASFALASRSSPGFTGQEGGVFQLMVCKPEV